MLDRRPERSEIRRAAENGSHLRETGCVGPSVTIRYAPPAHLPIVRAANYHTESLPGGNREYIIRPDGTINYTLRWELVFPLPPRLACFFFPPDIIVLFSSFLFSFLLLPLSLSFIHPPTFTMASALRLGTSALRSSIANKPAVQSAAFNGLRAYSTGNKVCADDCE